MFDENLTTEGMLEAEFNVGDSFHIGTAEFILTEPRVPCFKLGIRFWRGDIIKRFAISGRSRFYLAIEKTGELGTGDEIEFLSREPNQPNIADIVCERFHLY